MTRDTSLIKAMAERNACQPVKIKSRKKEMTHISNELRLTMILLITEFGLSCYLAARVLNMPYTNAKVIYRVFREDKRIVQGSRNPTGKTPFFAH